METMKKIFKFAAIFSLAFFLFNNKGQGKDIDTNHIFLSGPHASVLKVGTARTATIPRDLDKQYRSSSYEFYDEFSDKPKTTHPNEPITRIYIPLTITIDWHKELDKKYFPTLSFQVSVSLLDDNSNELIISESTTHIERHHSNTCACTYEYENAHFKVKPLSLINPFYSTLRKEGERMSGSTDELFYSQQTFYLSLPEEYPTPYIAEEEIYVKLDPEYWSDQKIALLHKGDFVIRISDIQFSDAVWTEQEFAQNENALARFEKNCQSLRNIGNSEQVFALADSFYHLPNIKNLSFVQYIRLKNAINSIKNTDEKATLLITTASYQNNSQAQLWQARMFPKISWHCRCTNSNGGTILCGG